MIDGITSVIKKSLVKAIRAQGSNQSFKIRFLNNRDHHDIFGRKNVSRVMVGGTIEELDCPTIGVSKSLDVGNANTSETGFCLHGLLSDSAPFNPNSRNKYGVDKAPRRMIFSVPWLVNSLRTKQGIIWVISTPIHILCQPSDELNIMDTGVFWNRLLAVSRKTISSVQLMIVISVLLPIYLKNLKGLLASKIP